MLAGPLVALAGVLALVVPSIRALPIRNLDSSGELSVWFLLFVGGGSFIHSQRPTGAFVAATFA
jgi:hypothetical protein